MDPDESFASALAAVGAKTDALLDRLLAPSPMAGELHRPKRLLDAMRYSSLAGGKRFRPFLVVAAASMFGVPRARALMVAAALECVHCYSLVHDDLPAMDDAALRRGRPTVHRAFDEATAILAGDGLLTLAFDILARAETHPSAAVRVELIAALARAAGLGGMAGGQMLDLAAEGRFGDGAPAIGEDEIAVLQAMKTGALIRFACCAGAILGAADADARADLARFGDALGAAYQIADDLLDVEGEPETIGKSPRQDAAAGKATLVARLGVAAARARLTALTDEAVAALARFGPAGAHLAAAARFVAARRA